MVHFIVDRHVRTIPPINIHYLYNSQSNSNIILLQEASDGHVEFKNVTFRYPFRRDVEVLSQFDLKVEPGQTAAIVGSSGSGKSTVVSLLQRLYDVESGSVVSVQYTALLEKALLHCNRFFLTGEAL